MPMKILYIKKWQNMSRRYRCLRVPATENRGITPQQKKWKNRKSNLACLLWSLTLCKDFK